MSSNNNYHRRYIVRVYDPNGSETFETFLNYHVPGDGYGLAHIKYIEEGPYKGRYAVVWERGR